MQRQEETAEPLYERVVTALGDAGLMVVEPEDGGEPVAEEAELAVLLAVAAPPHEDRLAWRASPGGDLVLDAVRQEVHRHGHVIPVTRMEFRLLALLVSEPGRAFTRTEIMQHLWRSEHIGNGRACDSHVLNLRRKLEDDPASPELIVTVRGVGFAFNP